MDELQRLHQLYEFHQNPDGDFPLSALLDELANEGRTKEFLEAIRSEPPFEQASFIAELARHRSADCLERLLELHENAEESVSIWAAVGLLHTDGFERGISTLRQASLARIKNKELGKGEWPLHAILGELIDEGDEIAVPTIKELLELAMTVFREGEESYDTIKLLFHRYVR